MTVFLVLFLIADAVVLLSAHFTHVDQAAVVCDLVLPLCQFPVALFILGVVAAGILLLQKA